MSRRQALRSLGLTVASIPFVRMIAGCTTSSQDASTVDSGTDGTTTTTPDAGTVITGGWATGGTAAMTGKASYPNPFASGTQTACALTCSATQGPCYDTKAETIQDISYGQNGLPTRMYFQVLDASCTPMAGATVDIWHVAPTGKYSGNDSPTENVAFCTANDTVYTSSLFFRGKQTTDANGVCFFDTCFPGWYAGRTLHVHFIVTANGKSTLTSQFVFDDALVDAIIADQPIYQDRGARSTTNQTDSVIKPAEAAAYAFMTEQLPDGAMLAYKTIIVSTTSCAL